MFGILIKRHWAARLYRRLSSSSPQPGLWLELERLEDRLVPTNTILFTNIGTSDTDTSNGVWQLSPDGTLAEVVQNLDPNQGSKPIYVPTGLCQDANGTIYFSDLGKRRADGSVVGYSGQAFKYANAVLTLLAGDLYGANGISFANNQVYVIDQGDGGGNLHSNTYSVPDPVVHDIRRIDPVSHSETLIYHGDTTADSNGYDGTHDPSLEAYPIPQWINVPTGIAYDAADSFPHSSDYYVYVADEQGPYDYGYNATYNTYFGYDEGTYLGQGTGTGEGTDLPGEIWRVDVSTGQAVPEAPGNAQTGRYFDIPGDVTVDRNGNGNVIVMGSSKLPSLGGIPTILIYQGELGSILYKIQFPYTGDYYMDDLNQNLNCFTVASSNVNGQDTFYVGTRSGNVDEVDPNYSTGQVNITRLAYGLGSISDIIVSGAGGEEAPTPPPPAGLLVPQADLASANVWSAEGSSSPTGSEGRQISFVMSSMHQEGHKVTEADSVTHIGAAAPAAADSVFADLGRDFSVANI